MIEDFDLMICQRVIDLLVERAKSGQNAKVAINLSARSLESSLFVTVLRKLLSPHRRIRADILLDLTESARVTRFEEMGKALGLLQRDGHTICLDDFGAGETNFAYLRAFHVDQVKFNGSHVRAVTSSRRGQSFIRAMAALSRDLGITTVAEMIEDADQARMVASLGAALGQGYLFGRPTPSFTISLLAGAGAVGGQPCQSTLIERSARHRPRQPGSSRTRSGGLCPSMNVLMLTNTRSPIAMRLSSVAEAMCGVSTTVSSASSLAGMAARA